MKWVRERDLLIAQTLAFVQSVSGKKPAAEGQPEAETRIDRQLEAIAEKAVTPEPSRAEPMRGERIRELPRMSALPTSDIRQEMLNRVALFRAHQQRFHRERDEFFATTMAQIRAPKKASTGPSP